MTPSLLGADLFESSSVRRATAGQRVSFGGHSFEWLPEDSGFVTDTWVFFAEAQVRSTGAELWALGFGPTDGSLPRWSLFHCVSTDRFDARCICPHLNPSNHDLHRWSASSVGPDTATSLLVSVGSSVAFYRQYFAERPDLLGSTARLMRP